MSLAPPQFSAALGSVPSFSANLMEEGTGDFGNTEISSSCLLNAFKNT